MIKAIETRYKGYRFRSRLEARWAVFFDALGLKWEYEPEGFELPSGRYLPDFKLLGIGVTRKSIYTEVKPEGGDSAKARELANVVGSVLLLDGPPDNRYYTLLIGSGGPGLRMCFAHFPGEARGDLYRGTGKGTPQRPAHAAINAARSARFEFGESGSIKTDRNYLDAFDALRRT